MGQENQGQIGRLKSWQLLLLAASRRLLNRLLCGQGGTVLCSLARDS